MPNLDAFSADPGVDAGRIQPTGVVPQDGLYVFCLGHDAPGYRAFIKPGDFVEVNQTGTFPAGNAFTFQARTRAPSALPPAPYVWKASVLLDDLEIGARPIDGLAIANDWEWYVDVAGLVGSHKVAFRLTFVGPNLPNPPPATNVPAIEVEIPAFYLDHLVFSTIATQPFITNEVPTANQGQTVGVAPTDDTSIDFDCFGLGQNVDPTTLHVTINGTDAIVAGVMQPGFHGLVGPSAEVMHVTVAPNIVFASASVVTVAVTVSTVAVVHTHSRSWTFEVADTTPPVMVFVQAIAPKQIRVTWSKAIDIDDPSSAHDGLNPALYYVQAVQPDGVTPVVDGGPVGPLIYTPTPYLLVESVQIVSDDDPTVIDLFMNEELTPSTTYELTEIGVTDLFGNFETSVTAFESFVLPVPLGRVLDLYRWVPTLNRQEDVTADLLRFIRCIQEPTNLLLYDIDTWTEILDVDLAPEPFLDAMLADLGNPFPFVLSVNQKRKLIRLLVAIYKQKGTAIGIINAVRFFLGLTVTITTFTGGTMLLGISELGVDWVLGPGTSFALYSFRVVSAISLTQAQIDQIAFIANYMKPAHTHLIEVVVPHILPPYDPVELGISELGVDWILHL